MIEIPEANTLAMQLNETVRGGEIKKVFAGRSPHRFAFFFGDPSYYPHLLEGSAITGAQATGGQVELFLEDGLHLVLNDGVNLRYLEQGEPPPQKHQLLLELADGASLVCTVQMYGGLHAFLDGENDNFYYLVGKEKPAPLSWQFDSAYFQGLLAAAKPSLSAKAFLATEQRIPGLGNGVLQDILFNAGIHPKSRLAALSGEEKERMFSSVKETLARMTEGGGRDTEKDLFGRAGGYASILSKAALSRPCPVCGGPILREAYLGGNIYYCPICQPLKK